VVGDRWTLLVVYGLLRGPARYSDLDVFASGAGSTLLTDRLRRLIEAGLVERSAEAHPGSPTLYRLTPRGEALVPAISELSSWGLELLIPQDPSALPPEGRPFNQAWTRPDPDGPEQETYLWSVDGQDFTFVVDGARVTQRAGRVGKPAVSLTCSREVLERRVRGELDWAAAIESGEVRVDGPRPAVERMFRITGLG
jgi:DNA-binding HxlR family transcriptional regulator